jgi:hypothetical protein
MAKETAHQIGTPLSSLIGRDTKSWQCEESITKEIEKDIERLQTIRTISKIGSEPVLERSDIVAETEASYTYLLNRFQQIEFTFEGPVIRYL